MKAYAHNYRQSPRKVRLLADLVRGKSVTKAVATLSFTDKRASAPFLKLLKSAIQNAKVQGKEEGALYISKVTVDKGTTIKRFMPRARGSASPIRKHSSHIAIHLSEKGGAKTLVKAK